MAKRNENPRSISKSRVRMLEKYVQNKEFDMAAKLVKEGHLGVDAYLTFAKGCESTAMDYMNRLREHTFEDRQDSIDFIVACCKSKIHWYWVKGACERYQIAIKDIFEDFLVCFSNSVPLLISQIIKEFKRSDLNGKQVAQLLEFCWEIGLTFEKRQDFNSVGDALECIKKFDVSKKVYKKVYDCCVRYEISSKDDFLTTYRIYRQAKLEPDNYVALLDKCTDEVLHLAIEKMPSNIQLEENLAEKVVQHCIERKSPKYAMNILKSGKAEHLLDTVHDLVIELGDLKLAKLTSEIQDQALTNSDYHALLLHHFESLTFEEVTSEPKKCLFDGLKIVQEGVLGQDGALKALLYLMDKYGEGPIPQYQSGIGLETTYESTCLDEYIKYAKEAKLSTKVYVPELINFCIRMYPYLAVELANTLLYELNETDFRKIFEGCIKSRASKEAQKIADLNKFELTDQDVEKLCEIETIY